ncbi:hypothetical protein KCG48_11910 [Proteiniclasticum sp. BAD-10]|uniref:DUF4181 domain-containing protein n=1 Tax=Proteiniclasticum sediminis TaxID=2804028 RepID=A0A941CQG2_9CLOT|nr:hypothetical protein [Proteiniclasticum sediminis]MBR0577021.1 hypothetical protein [Proteiniclasticum sediminis]
MTAYVLGLFLTLVVVVFWSTLHLGSKMTYKLNRIWRKEQNGMRLFNRFSLAWILPWLFLPFIGSTYFRTYYVIYILLFILAMEDVLYLIALTTGKNEEKVWIMLLFNLLGALLLYSIYLTFLPIPAL